ncbi:MAG: hypothetical protein ABSA57_01700 [Candidatus Acidiferrales bacterium]
MNSWHSKLFAVSLALAIFSFLAAPASAASHHHHHRHGRHGHHGAHHASKHS